jgi:hypothetical protein
MLFQRRKDKAMAPQVETVELPDIVEPVQETNGWMFPRHWSDDDVRDWLATHPTGDQVPPTVVTIPNSDVPAPEKHYEDCAPECDGDRTETDDELASEQDVANALKADGIYAAAFALPMDLQEKITSENYNPEEFFLVHMRVWNELVDATHGEAELGLENKDLRKQLNAQKRGMRKVNKHWSATKRELKQLEREITAAHEGYRTLAVQAGDRHREELKRERILTTRVARRLRKARAGRDKRERQVAQLQQQMQQLDYVIGKQAEYIEHLESLLIPGQSRS